MGRWNGYGPGHCGNNSGNKDFKVNWLFLLVLEKVKRQKMTLKIVIIITIAQT